MARGLMRWPAVVGAALLVGSVALYRGGPSPNATYVRWRHDRKLIASDSLVRVRRTIDSLQLRLGRGERFYKLGLRRPGIALVWADDSGRTFRVPPGDSTGLDSAWAHLPARDPAVRVLIRLGWVWPAGRTEVPDDAAPTLCIANAWRVDARDARKWDEAIGACGYYAAFGRPGPAVDSWLAHSIIGGYAAPLGVPTTADTGSWDVKERHLWATDGWGLRFTRSELPPPYASIHTARCAAALPGHCASAALDTSRTLPWFYSTGDLSGLGGLEYQLLTDAESQFGPDRFRAFWKSDADVPAAFQQAFGVPMDQWVHREVVDFYGPLELGGGDVGHAALSVILWTLAFLGLTGVIARRLRY